MLTSIQLKSCKRKLFIIDRPVNPLFVLTPGITTLPECAYLCMNFSMPVGTQTLTDKLFVTYVPVHLFIPVYMCIFIFLYMYIFIYITYKYVLHRHINMENL